MHEGVDDARYDALALAALSARLDLERKPRVRRRIGLRQHIDRMHVMQRRENLHQLGMERPIGTGLHSLPQLPQVLQRVYAILCALDRKMSVDALEQLSGLIDDQLASVVRRALSIRGGKKI